MLLKIFSLISLILAMCLIIWFKDKYNNLRVVFLLLCLIYLALVLCFTIFRSKCDTTINSFIPFSSLFQITHVRWYGWGEYIFMESVGNVLLFIPLGLMIANCTKIKRPRIFSIIVALIFSVSIEITQLATSIGSFEADDIIANTFGALFGCSIGILIQNRKKLDAKQMIITVMPLIIYIALMFAVCVIPVSREFFMYK